MANLVDMAEIHDKQDEQEAQEEIKCTPGHETQCGNAISDNCNCDCGGRNHGRLRQDG